VSVVIPTHNEAQSIGRVLADLPANIVTEVLVVDSNSTDGTPEIASKWEPASSMNLVADTVAYFRKVPPCGLSCG
jgi:glycosyltransferase involved in cell wall biosynthesis